MKHLLALTGIVLSASVLAQPGPTTTEQRMLDLMARIRPAQEVTDLRITPLHPSEKDTLTVSFRARVPSAFGYVHEVQQIVREPDPGIFPPDQRQEQPTPVLNVRFALPDHGECTADKAIDRTLTVRIPPKPAGTYRLVMTGYGTPDRSDFVYNGPEVLFTVAPGKTSH